jgi:hypothetical protein
MQGAVGVFIGTYLLSVLGNGAMAWHCEMASRKLPAAPAASVGCP